MKFALLVEGKTEDLGVASFLSGWLNQYFQPGSQVGIRTIGHRGWARLVLELPEKVRQILTDPRSRDETIAVLSLLDLYGPDFWPAEVHSVEDKCRWGTGHMISLVRNHFDACGLPAALAEKYRHYFAVHETEAWLIAQPGLFPRPVATALQRHEPPEKVNFNNPPAELLEGLYIRHDLGAYKKATVARKLFRDIDPNEAARKCPYLEAMLADMRGMALAAGAQPLGEWAGG